MYIKELLSLKVCLITGGEGKSDRCITGAIAEADVKVIIASPFVDDANKVIDEMTKHGLDITAMYVDKADHDSVLKLKDEIKKKFGRLNVFVNNAVLCPMKTYTLPLCESAYDAIQSQKNYYRARLRPY